MRVAPPSARRHFGPTQAASPRIPLTIEAVRPSPLLALVVLASCSEPAPIPDAGPDSGPPLVCTAPATSSRLVVTADWLARSLTLFGLDRIRDPGCSADEARVGTIDLSAYAPGPIELELTPDGTTAVVAVGPGFYDGFGAALVGRPDYELDGTLLLVDLIERRVTAEIETMHIPMGIAISPDGTRAYVAEYGHNGAPGTRIAIVDLTTRALLDEVEVGSRPEQVVLNGDGTLGALSIDDGIRVFRTDDLAGSLSPTLATGRDPSDIDFVPGTDLLVVSNSMASSCSIVDASDPSAPFVVADVRTFGGSPYAVTWIPGTEDVLVTTSVREQLLRIRATDPTASQERYPLPDGAFLLQVAVDAEHGIALVPHPVTHMLAVVDLATHAQHGIRWLDAVGPTYVAIQSAR